jgi:hypothetical protein
MSPLHQNQPHEAPGYRPDTLVGYLALQREAELSRAATLSRPTQIMPRASAANSLPQRALAPAAGSRFRELLSRAAATYRRTAPAPARLGQADGELVCCA